MQDFARYLSLNAGLGSLVTHDKSPKQIIEGYRDPKLVKIRSQSLYEGGDVHLPDTVNFSNLPMTSQITFMRGTEDQPELARSIHSLSTEKPPFSSG